MKELAQLQKEKNDWRCNSWLETATGRSTILGAPAGASSLQDFASHPHVLHMKNSRKALTMRWLLIHIYGQTEPCRFFLPDSAFALV